MSGARWGALPKGNSAKSNTARPAKSSTLSFLTLPSALRPKHLRSRSPILRRVEIPDALRMRTQKIGELKNDDGEEPAAWNRRGFCNDRRRAGGRSAGEGQTGRICKVCSLYGVGFYYIPGTDMCIKIGGWVRAEYGWGNNGNFTWGWANGNVNDRTTNNRTSAPAVTSRLMPATRPNTARCAVTSRSVSARTSTAATSTPRTHSVRTAPSSSGRVSRLAVRSRSLTSTATRRLHTGVPSRVPTRVTAAGS